MGGGNGLKSSMSRDKNQAKKEAERAGGGGKEGKNSREVSKIGVICAVCKTNFTSNKMKQQLKDHWESKHGKMTFNDCFPTETCI